MTKLRHVEAFTNRHGKLVYYYRPDKGTRFRIYGVPGTEDFIASYHKAVKDRENFLFHHSPDISEEAKERVVQVLLKRAKNARSRDKKKGRHGNLTEQWIRDQLEAQGYCCAVTGISFLKSSRKGRIEPFNPSLDRIDNAKGYEVGNVRIVVFAVNMMMLDWGDSVFDLVAEAYVRRKNAPHLREIAHTQNDAPQFQVLANQNNPVGGPARTTDTASFPHTSQGVGRSNCH